MKFIVISQSTQAKLKEAAINNQLNLDASTILPDGKIGIPVDDDVYERLESLIDVITPTHDAVIASLFINKH